MPFAPITFALLLALYKISIDAPSPFLYEEEHTIFARGLRTGRLLIKRLIPLYIGAIVGPIGGHGIITLIPVLAHTWNIPFSTAALSITIYMIPYILIQVVSGSIAQIWDVRKTLFLGFAIYALGATLSGLAWNFEAFVIFRVIQGMGAAFLTPIIMALIGDLVPTRHLGKAMGGLGLAYTAGMTMGPFISGVIEVYFGWQAFLFLLAFLAVITAFLFWIWSTGMETTRDSGHSISYIFPLIRQAFFYPGVRSLSFAAFALFIAFIGVMTFTADYMKTMQGLSSDRVGFLLSMTGISGLIVSPLAGYLGDRFGRRTIFLCGMAIVLVSFLMMVWMHFEYFTYALLFLLYGTGTATAWTSLNTMAVELSPPRRNSVTSLYNSVKFTGYALSPLILSIFYINDDLKAVLAACIVAVVISCLLQIRSGVR